MIDASLLPSLLDVLTVGRSGSVGAASRKLHKTPSAVSQQVRRVEQHFGVRLFERKGRGLVPSPAGHVALEILGQLFEEAEGVFGRFAELAGSPPSILRVAASEYLGRALLAPVLRDLIARSAELRFEIMTTHSGEALRMVERGDADFAVASASHVGSSLSERLLFTQPFLWVGPKAPRGAPLVERLHREPVLRLSQGSEGRRLLDDFVERARVRPLSTIDVPNVSLLLDYASDGLGIGLVPALGLDDRRERSLAVERAEVDSLPVRLVHRTSFRHGVVAGTFVERLLTESRVASARIERRATR